MSPNFLSTYSIWISIHWVRTVGRLWPLADLCFVQAVFCGVPMSAKRPQQGEALCNDAERKALSPVAWYLLSAFQIISERRWKGGFVTRGVIPPFSLSDHFRSRTWYRPKKSTHWPQEWFETTQSDQSWKESAPLVTRVTSWRCHLLREKGQEGGQSDVKTCGLKVFKHVLKQFSSVQNHCWLLI